MNQKQLLRKKMRLWRQNIEPDVRQNAEFRALRSLKGFFETFSYVLSYASFKDEFSTSEINDHLLSQGKLLLPHMENNNLQAYSVQNLHDQLKLNEYGFFEPDPAKCSRADKESRTLVLVPGLAFDEQRHRLGYGKGYYDRLLSTLPQNWTSFGLGFQGQLVEKIPTTEYDVALNGVFLF